MHYLPISRTWSEADLAHFGHGNMYTSIYSNPASLALAIVWMAFESGLPMLRYPRTIKKSYPSFLRHLKSDEYISDATSIPLIAILSRRLGKPSSKIIQVILNIFLFRSADSRSEKTSKQNPVAIWAYFN